MKYAKKYGFTKVRRSPNMNQTVYKKIFRIPFDCALKNSGFQTTEYFGNLIDIKPHLETLEKLDSVEIMTHPKNIDGIEYIDFYSDLKLQDWESIIMEITTERQ